MAERPTLIDYLIVIFKWKKAVFAVTSVAVIVTAVVVCLIPPVYVGKTRVLPPETDHSSTALQLMGQGGGASLPGAILGKKSMNDLYIGLLQSRTVLDRMVHRFGLVEAYGAAYREEAREELLSRLQAVNDRKSGVITITVEDRDPKRAAEMANAFVVELKKLTREIALTEASQRRLFYEEKMKEARESMARSEEAMKGFQEQTGAIEMKEQAKAIIESVAKLRGDIAAKQVQLKVLRTYSMPQNPDLQKTEEELRGMKEQLSRLEGKRGGSALLLSSGNVPEAGAGYARKMRDMKHSEAVLEVLAKQYEVAKIDESRNNATIQVIDAADVPEKRARPDRARAVGIALVAGLIGGVLWSFILESRERISRDPEMCNKLARLKEYALLRPGSQRLAINRESLNG